MSLKCYSDWQLGAIQIDLTPFTLCITEDSEKQLMINPLFTGISLIRMLGDRNVFYVSPAHYEILTLPPIARNMSIMQMTLSTHVTARIHQDTHLPRSTARQHMI